MSIFSNFDVEIPKSLEEVNIIGVDFGDGDLCASIIEIQHSKNNIVYIRPLLINNNGINKIENILNININTNKPTTIGNLGDYVDEIPVCNFKWCPGENRSKLKIFKNNRLSLTNAECMQYAFNIFINMLFSVNDSRIDINKPSILLVGRPASDKWKNSEKEYAALLKEKLKIKGYSQPVAIVIVSESLAALARATKADEKERIRPGENAIVVDCGSSTFDMTLVRQGTVPDGGEYSRQFGAKIVEELMLKRFRDEYPEKKPIDRIHILKILLRGDKEAFYGTEGNNGTQRRMAYVAFENEPEPIVVSKIINREFMDQALTKTGPVVIPSSMESIPQEEYKSWIEGCRAVFNGAKQHADMCLKEKKLDKIVLTGGASVMPEVQTILNKYFKDVTFVFPSRPNYMVSEGLAYVGMVEILKHEHLIKLINEIKNVINDSTSNINNDFANSLARYEWNIFINILDTWTNRNYDSSISELKRMWQEQYREYENVINAEIREWYEKYNINSTIIEYIDENFNAIFPDFNGVFQFEINKNAILSGLYTSSYQFRFNYSNFLGWFDKIIRFFAYIPIVEDFIDDPIFTSLSAKKRCKIRDRIYKKKYEIVEQMRIDSRDAVYNAGLEKKVKLKLMNILIPYIKDYVEKMTPYFNMSETHNTESST